ncbi:hypothetical protein Cantr_04615 [Candida viswanathii]|uniref:Uncharacterized protein n=1 Tax=Candida viswanathii TaxID=5486 RepID=A0A367XN89_9ASCO|nr:hypothetical protein Cantr_04615 [Candida viswanathii]
MSYSYSSSYHQLVEATTNTSTANRKKFSPHPLIYDLLSHPDLNIITPTPARPTNSTLMRTTATTNSTTPTPPPIPLDFTRMLTPDQFGMSTWQNIDVRVPPDSILSSEGEDLDLEDIDPSHVMVFESEEEEGEDGEENTFIMPRMSVSSQGKNNSLTTTASHNNIAVNSSTLQTPCTAKTELVVIVRSTQEEDLGSFNDPLGLLDGWNVIYSFLVGIGLGLGFGFGFFY